MEKFLAEERRQRWEKIKSASIGTSNPKSHPEGFILKVHTIFIEEPSPYLTDAKAQRLENESSSAADKTVVAVPPIGGVLSTPIAWWNYVNIDPLWFKSSHIPFSKEFPANYQAFCFKPVSVLVNMKDKFMLRELMLHEVEHGRRDKVVKKLEVKLKEYMDAFNETQRLLHSLQ